jgi:hypothetical protein
LRPAVVDTAEAVELAGMRSCSDAALYVVETERSAP